MWLLYLLRSRQCLFGIIDQFFLIVYRGVPTESVARSQARAERIQNLMMELPIP